MVLGIAEGFTSNVFLDKQLTDIPNSGIYLNSGVHPSITLENLLAFLPDAEITFQIWNNTTSYTSFDVSRKRDSIVDYNGILWQCIKANTGTTPVEGEFWTQTNIASLRIKAFIQKVKDRVYADLHLDKRLVNNQFIYEAADVNGDEKQMPGDFVAWVFEAKGSDYVAVKVNQIGIQKKSTTPLNLYVINQGQLIETVQITPKNGVLDFDNVDIVLSGKGKWMLAIDSTTVLTDGATIDPLRFDGFVAYTATGIGGAPESATYSYGTNGIGIGLNVSAYFDGSLFIENNVNWLASYIRAAFSLMVFEMFFHNSNNQSARAQRIQMDDAVLLGELKNTEADTVVSRYYKERKKAQALIRKTFDTQLFQSDDLEVTVSSV